jgi:hypothetical protein
MGMPAALRSVRQIVDGTGGSLDDLMEKLGDDYLHEEVVEALKYMERHGEVEFEPTSKIIQSFKDRGLPSTTGTKNARARDSVSRRRTA